MTCPPVLFLADKPEHSDAHWRVIRPAVRLKEAGVDAAVCWLGSDQLPTRAVEGRVVVLQRVIMHSEDAATAWVAQLRAAGALAVVFELDDDELTGANIDHMDATQPLSAEHRAVLLQQATALRWTLAACDGATVSTDPLADVVRRYTDKPVITVPNAIDTAWFRARLAPRAPWADHLTIGWAGWRRPDADLEPMAVAWGRIAARYPAVRFVVAGHQPDVIYRQPIDLDRIIRLPIAPLDEYPPLHQVDIGCCAVADSPFSRCKSPIKAWEYALAGAAVVATPTLYGAVVTDGVDGMLAETADDWERCISWLLEMQEHRRQFIRNQVRRIERDHSLSTQLHRWADSYTEIVASVRVPA